ncbi:MAG: polysaccharide lyase 6 family protein [Pirellulales bacterium]|nr:polysaccharide lyase 6 family protein [Pirellulales bacterium]
MPICQVNALKSKSSIHALARTSYRRILRLAAIALILAIPALGFTQIIVSNPDELTSSLGKAQPDDEIVVRNGSYNDWIFDISRSGTSSAPILIRAEVPGKVILSGKSRIEIKGDHVTIRGFWFKNGEADDAIWYMSGSHSRITDCALTDYKDDRCKWIRLKYGKNNRLDHNYISGKTKRDVTLQIDVSNSEKLNHHRIDHNYFGPRAKGWGNGWETIRNGYSHQQNYPAYNLFEHNLFHQCDGEIEIISSKSSHNTYRYNTFRDCAGELTLRHGKYNLVDGNFFFGQGKKGSAGIRIIGEGHRVVNNYIDKTSLAGIHIYEGDDDAQPTGYQPTNDVLIAFNTIVNSKSSGIQVREYGRIPRNIIIANNLFVGNASAVAGLSASQLSKGYSFHGNIAYSNEVPVATPQSAFKSLDPKLVRDSHGVLRPAEGSPVIGAATSDYENFGFQVKADLDGQRRPESKDVGADQVNATGEIINRPLDTSDIGKSIGPSWMKKGMAATDYLPHE